MKQYNEEMTKTEIKPLTVQVLDLQEGETVSSAAITHYPPSGTALTLTGTVVSPYINLLIGPFGLTGFHLVKVQAIGSLGSKPEVIYQIHVKNF